MSEPLNTKQPIPMTHDEREVLRGIAAQAGLTTGLMARALLLHAMDGVGDQGTLARIERERTEAATRIADGARAAVAMRWGTPGAHGAQDDEEDS